LAYIFRDTLPPHTQAGEKEMKGGDPRVSGKTKEAPTPCLGYQGRLPEGGNILVEVGKEAESIPDRNLLEM
jgi:hypothetical protein